jgi:hypothetical protein
VHVDDNGQLGTDDGGSGDDHERTCHHDHHDDHASP